MTCSENNEANDLVKVLLDHVNALLDLDKFAVDDTQLRVDRAQVHNKLIIFSIKDSQN